MVWDCANIGMARQSDAIRDKKANRFVRIGFSATCDEASDISRKRRSQGLNGWLALSGSKFLIDRVEHTLAER
jgi:hypothetical protein